MTQVVVHDRAGAEHRLAIAPGRTLMETIRDAGLDELLALCGGVCSCATCHVHVDSEFAALLPAMSEDENDLLDASSYRDGRSRLSCQIRLGEDLAGLRVTIAEED